MLNHPKRFPGWRRRLTAIATTPLFLVTAWVAIAAHRPLLAQTPATAPAFKVPDSLPQGTSMKVASSSSMELISQALKQQFEAKFPGTTVNLSSSNTNESLQALLSNAVDLATVGRPLTAAEKAQGLQEVPISREKIAIIVGADNPFKASLTAEQFAKIFRGEITNWAQVGGPNAPIRVIDRPESSDTRQALSQYPMFQAAPFKTGANATQVMDDATATVVKELGRDGISYAIAGQVLNQPNVTVLPMHETLPSDPRYPYSQPRSFVYKDTANAGVLAFIGFSTSAPGQAVVAAAKQQEAAGGVTGGSATVPGTTPPGTTPPGTTAPGTTAPGATTPGTTAPSAEAGAMTPAPAGNAFDWTPLLWLLLPLLGLPLLLWWFKGRGGAVPPVAEATSQGRMILTPRHCQDAYAFWEIPEAEFAAAREQGGRDLKVRLYDVTDNRQLDQAAPETVKEFDCVPGEPDLHLPIAVDNRDYVAELGYLTANNQWLRLGRSPAVRVPACTPTGSGSRLPAAAIAAGSAAAAIGAATAAKTRATESAVTAPSRVILVPRTPTDGYVYWEVPAARQAELQQAGGQNLMVRLHDTTGINLDQATTQPVQQYAADPQAADLHVPIPTPDRDYVAELGYTTADNRWLSLAQSEPVHVPATMPGVVDKTVAINAAATAAATQIAADVDTVRGDAPAQGLTARLGEMTGTVGGLAGDATKAVGAAIAGGTAAISGFSPVKSLLARQSADPAALLEQTPDCRIILVPRSEQEAYAYWEVAEAYKQARRDQGGQRLMLRIHDATNLDIDREAPHSTQTYVCHETDQDKHIVIPMRDRDYIAELGYFTNDNRWLRIIRSLHVRIPAQ